MASGTEKAKKDGSVPHGEEQDMLSDTKKDIFLRLCFIK